MVMEEVAVCTYVRCFQGLKIDGLEGKPLLVEII
jgi:hypothetical protein